MYNTSDYKCISIWGSILGSYGNYIKGEQRKAASDNAPITAIYKSDTGWVLAEDIENQEVKGRILKQLAILASK